MREKIILMQTNQSSFTGTHLFRPSHLCSIAPVRFAVLREKLLKPAEYGHTVLCYPLADKGTSISSHGPVYHATGIEVGFCPVSFDPENGSNNPKSLVKIVIYM